MVIVIGSAPWAIGSADRKHTQSAILFRASLLTSVFMTPAYGPGTPFGELKVTRRTGVLRGGPGLPGNGANRPFISLVAGLAPGPRGHEMLRRAVATDCAPTPLRAIADSLSHPSFCEIARADG